MKYSGKRYASSAELDFVNSPKGKRILEREKKMKHRFAADCHSHSHCSPDGKEPVESMLHRAGEIGLFAYTLTDHCECQEFEEKYRTAAKASWNEMEQAAESCPPGLRFYRGIELGQPLQNLAAAGEVVAGRPYDFIIGSLHNLSGGEDFYHLGQREPCPEQWDGLFSRYFQEILEMIRWGGFDSLAHITYPLRYLTAPGEQPSFHAHREELDAVLTALVRADEALEMNTSRLLMEGASRLPDLEIFTRYRELGGRLVTLGSDAHTVENLGKGIDEGMEILRQAGFSEFAVYERRKPLFLPLE